MLEQPQNTRTLDGLARLFLSLFTYAPYKLSLTLLLIMLGGIAEASGIAMIIPLLHIIQPTASSSDTLSQLMLQIADTVGFEWTLLTVLGVFLATSLFRSVLTMKRDLFVIEITNGFISHCMKKIYTCTVQATWECLKNCRQSDLQYILNTQVRRTKQSTKLLMDTMGLAGMIILKLILAVLISPVAAIMLILICATVIIFKNSFLRHTGTYNKNISSQTWRQQNYTVDFLLGLKFAKSHHLEETYIRRFANIIGNIFQTEQHFSFTNKIIQMTLELIAALAVVIMIWFLLSYSTLMMPEIIIMAVIFLRTVPPLIAMMNNVQNLTANIPAHTHLQEVSQKLQNNNEVLDSDNQSSITLYSSLTAQDISFSYTDANATEKPVLTNTDLQIPAKKITVITGISGAGKSTLAEILIGLLKPSNGKILIDGKQLSMHDIPGWRRSIAYVPQQPHLFHGTIRETLLWALPEASESDIWEALHLGSAKEFVAALPKGIDTVIGDRGTYLSGGEQHRIALAQALIKKPTLIMLDEVTSQLDTKNKIRILTTLTSLREQMTIVMISHSLDVMEKSDKIIIFNPGGTTTIGTWSELAAELKNIKNIENNDKTTVAATSNF